MFIKFGDKTEKVVVKNSTNDDGTDETNDDENDEEKDCDLYDRRAQLLKKYKNKKLHKNI